MLKRIFEERKTNKIQRPQSGHQTMKMNQLSLLVQFIQIQAHTLTINTINNTDFAVYISKFQAF